MKFLNIRYLSILLIILISGAIGSSVTMIVVGTNAQKDTINVLLYDLNNELDILIHSAENHASDHFLRKKAEGLVVGKLLMMSVTKPDISKLQGIPLDAVHRTINYLKEYEWESREGKETFVVVKAYLSNIENIVFELKSKRDEILRKPLKSP